MTQPPRSIAFCATLLVLAACTPAIAPSTTDGPGRQSAYFESFPSPLFAAIAAGCQGDADRFTLISEREVLCESLPTPEAAAALILEFDGDVETLPRQVITLRARPAAPGYTVTTEYYYLVPQKNGDIAEVRFAERRVERTIRRAFAMAGGQSI